MRMEKKQRLLSVLNAIIPTQGTSGAGDEIHYHCPFCNHHKKKLQINIETQQWHCWVCDAKGRSLFTLAKKLKASKEVFDELSQIIGNNNYSKSKTPKTSFLQIPEEFKTLVGECDAISFLHAKKYLLQRGLSEEDIQKYNIGYCQDGEYKSRIIVPSYDSMGKLNYFIARSYYGSNFKYKNPPVPKDTIIFDLFINWKMPIILCEGIFDAIAIKRNAIPLLGKTIQSTLLQKMIKKRISEVTIILDSDAQDTMINVSKKLIRYGLNVSRVSLENGDPSDLGFKAMLDKVKHKIQVNDFDLIKQKMSL